MFFKNSLTLFVVVLALTWNGAFGDDVITVAEYKAALQQSKQQLERFNIITETLEKIRDLLDQAAQIGRDKLMEVLQSDLLKTLLNFLPSSLRDWLDRYIKGLLENLGDPAAYENLHRALKAVAQTYKEANFRVKQV